MSSLPQVETFINTKIAIGESAVTVYEREYVVNALRRIRLVAAKRWDGRDPTGIPTEQQIKAGNRLSALNAIFHGLKLDTEGSTDVPGDLPSFEWNIGSLVFSYPSPLPCGHRPDSLMEERCSRAANDFDDRVSCLACGTEFAVAETPQLMALLDGARQNYARMCRLLSDVDLLTWAAAFVGPSLEKYTAAEVFERALTRTRVAWNQMVKDKVSPSSFHPMIPDVIACPNCFGLLAFPSHVRQASQARPIQCNRCNQAFCAHCRFPGGPQMHRVSCCVAERLREAACHPTPFLTPEEDAPNACTLTMNAAAGVGKALGGAASAVGKHGKTALVSTAKAGKKVGKAGITVVGGIVMVPLCTVAAVGFVVASPVILFAICAGTYDIVTKSDKCSIC